MMALLIIPEEYATSMQNEITDVLLFISKIKDYQVQEIQV